MLPKLKTEMSMDARLSAFQTPIFLRRASKSGLKTVDPGNKGRLVIGTGCPSGVEVRLPIADLLAHCVNPKRQFGDRPCLLVQFAFQTKLLGCHILQFRARPFEFKPEVDCFGRIANWNTSLAGLDDAVAPFDVPIVLGDRLDSPTLPI